MRVAAVTAILSLSCTLAHAGPQADAAGFQVAQNCGWFAILGCFRTRGEANDWNDRIDDGHVINTSAAAYPNFRPGFYCVVNGPTAHGRAESIVRGWRRVVPDAYAKNAC